AVRTRIVDADSGVVAQVAPPGELAATTEVIELDRSQVAEWAARRASRPIDLTVGPADSVLLRHDDGTSSWYLAFHHVAIDATSAAKVFGLVGATYDALLTGTALPAAGPNDSYYQWYRQATRTPSPRAAKADQFWATRREAPKIGRLYDAVTKPTPRSRRVEVDPADRLTRARALLDGDLRMLSVELGWTTLMISAAALYLHRLTGADRFAIGMPVHNRSTPEARDVVGPVMDVFGVDITIEPDDTARSLHKRIGRSILTTLRNAELGRSAPADYETVVNVIPNMGYGDFSLIPASTTWIRRCHRPHPPPSAAHRLWPELQLALDLKAAAGPEHARRAPALPGHARCLPRRTRRADRRSLDRDPRGIGATRRLGHRPDAGRSSGSGHRAAAQRRERSDRRGSKRPMVRRR
ncbi:MAG: condensation domain-containing protein, partial [Acidimicrobiales bacterium]